VSRFHLHVKRDTAKPERIIGQRIAHARFVLRVVLRVALGVFLCAPLAAYSVLTHEAIIDSAWDGSIRPLLVARFPASTPEDLIRAHGYAYAGCILQDMGYYPFGNKFFSDLVHYVRTGDFVANLIRESSNLNEYAFALGAMAHYAADTNGHSIAVNQSVALQYPKLRRKYGSVVTYEDDPTAHIRVEFSFDVLQVARGNYAPEAYHDFIGFQVAVPVLERAFHDTYALDLGEVLPDLDLSLGTFRFAVRTVIPEVTRGAWHLDKRQLIQAQHGLTRRRFVYNLSHASFHKEWGTNHVETSLGARLLAFLVRILPKIGPLKALSFKPPTPETDGLFQASFNRTLDVYRSLLREAGTSLDNRDLDTGEPTAPNEYRMADDAYATLAVKLAEKPAAAIDPKLREAILEYFRDPNLPFATKRKPEEWRATLAAIEKLKSQVSAGQE